MGVTRDPDAVAAFFGRLLPVVAARVDAAAAAEDAEEAASSLAAFCVSR
jgi:hypothetical protein